MRTTGQAGQAGAGVSEILNLEEESMLGECLLSLCERQEYLLGAWELSGNALVQRMSQVMVRFPEKEILVIFYGKGMSSLFLRRNELKKYDRVILALDRPIEELDLIFKTELESLLIFIKNLTIFYKSRKDLSCFFHYSLDLTDSKSAFSSLVRLLEKAGKKEDSHFA